MLLAVLQQDLGYDHAASDVPNVFCWTKMGTEAGQALSDIIRRKELERRAGNGTFAWGIGNSLGEATAQARETVPRGLVEVLFTPMKSPAKLVDQNPSSLLLWTSYFTESNRLASLPLHSLVTSRGGKAKRAHYALICRSDESLLEEGNSGMLDAARARNLRTLNPVGASQVTAVVKYSHKPCDTVEKPYKISFRATLHREGFVRLAAPVLLSHELLDMYQEACGASSISAWRKHTRALREAAQQQLSECSAL